MPVQVLVGPPRCGKTTELLNVYRRELARRQAGSALWLAPTQRGVGEIRDALLNDELTGCFAPNVMTFAQFAELVIRASDQSIKPIDPVEKRELLRWTIAELHDAGRLRYFMPLADKAGLVDLLSAFISDLKRLEIWPEDFGQAVEHGGMRPKDHDLLLVYQTYQQRLTEHQLYDAEGRFWSARSLLAQGQRRPFERLRMVVVDGFTDFTRPQHEILATLAARVERMFVSLPGESEANRPELFQKPNQTLQRLMSGLPTLQSQPYGRRLRDNWPAMNHLERNLFRNPRQRDPAETSAGVEILPAASALDEIRQVGRRIKQLLTTGDATSGYHPVVPHEVVVVFRTLTPYAATVREVFHELGVPIALESGDPIQQAPAIAVLVQILRLAAEDWPFNSVLAMVGGNYLAPPWDEWSPQTPREIQSLVRTLQIPSGRDALLARVAHWARRPLPSDDDEDPPEGSRDLRRQRRLVGLAQRVGPALKRLAATLDRLPDQATAGGWRAAIEQVAGELGIDGVLRAELDTSQLRPPDAMAWRRLLDALSSADRLSERLGVEAPRYTATEILTRVHQLAASVELKRDPDEIGRVRVLSATTARSVSAPYLFLAGLTETAFPPPQSESRLYTETELAALVDRGLPFVLRAERSSEEMLLFYEVVTRANRRLILSYPALDSRAQPLLPSPYLDELARTVGIDPESISLPNPDPLPQGAPLSLGELRVTAMARALGLAANAQPDATWLAGLASAGVAPAQVDNLRAALHMLRQRRQRDEFGPYRGIFTSPATLERLQADLAKKEAWSPSHLELYGTCPFKYLGEKLLRLEPLADVALATDHAARGTVLHEVLARLHRQLNALHDGPTPLDQVDDAEFTRVLNDVLSEISAEGDRDDPLAAALGNIDLQLARRWLANYREQHARYRNLTPDLAQGLAPAHFEVGFGLIKPADDDPLSTEAPLELHVGEGVVRFRGRIDRIDTGRVGSQPVFAVIDYKSGSSNGYTKDAITTGKKLQLALYALAAQRLLLVGEDALPLLATYWFVKNEGPKNPVMGLSDSTNGEKPPLLDAWNAMEQAITDRINRLLRSIRLGQFPVYNPDKNCTQYCDLAKICRISEVRNANLEFEP